MSTLAYIVLGIVIFIVLAGVAQALLRYWEEQVNLTEEAQDLEQRVKQLNDQLANRRSDDEIVRILSGQETPTLGRERRQRP